MAKSSPTGFLFCDFQDAEVRLVDGSEVTTTSDFNSIRQGRSASQRAKRATRTIATEGGKDARGVEKHARGPQGMKDGDA